MTDRRIALLLLLSLLLLALGIGVLLAWHRASFQAMPAAQVASPLTSPGGAQCHSLDGLPDPVCTPGAADPRVTQDNLQTTICVSGYTTRVRPSTSYTNALKRTQITEYGYTDTNLADYEEDHLIPLELGGHPSDPRNLWPEPLGGAHPATTKDRVENSLHAKVCAGLQALAAAQAAIAGNWESVPF